MKDFFYRFWLVILIILAIIASFFLTSSKDSKKCDDACYPDAVFKCKHDALKQPIEAICIKADRKVIK